MTAVAAELAREVVCAGFDGTSAEDVPLDDLRALGARSLILFARNVTSGAQVTALNALLCDALNDPLIGVDQEGGRVARVRDGVVSLPSMMALGATRDAALAAAAGEQLGADLVRLGFGIDFAPALDLALEPANTVIGNRSFGEDPSLVAELGIAFAHGLAAGGTIPVVKHFPGHGATSTDSHLALPVLNVDAATWRRREVQPFAAAIAAGLPAIMSAHVVMPAFDAQRPATLSPAILTGILRKELGFDGAIFTDDLEMNAVAASPGTAQAAVQALAAGADCVVISHRLELARAAIDAIERAVADGTLPRARLEDAAERMRRLRTAPRGSSKGPAPEIGAEIARRAITVVRGSIALAPGEPITVVAFEPSPTTTLSSVLRGRAHKSEIMRVPLDPDAGDLALLEMVLRGLPSRPVAVVVRRAHLHPAQAQAVASILSIAPDAMVISALEPYDIALFPQARNVACMYDDGTLSFEALADVMTARSVATGRLPVRIEAVAAR